MPTPEEVDAFLNSTEPLPGETWDQWKARLLKCALPEWWPDDQQQFMSGMRALLELKAEEQPKEKKFQELLADWDARSVLNGDRIFDQMRNEFYRLTVERTRRPGWEIRTVTRPLPDRNRLGWPMFRTTREDEMPKADGRFRTIQDFVEEHPNFRGLWIGGKFFPNPNFDTNKD